MQLVLYNTGRGMMRKIGGQIMNVISSTARESNTAEKMAGTKAITPRKGLAV